MQMFLKTQNLYEFTNAMFLGLERKMLVFSYGLLLTCVLGAQKNRLIETAFCVPTTCFYEK